MNCKGGTAVTFDEKGCVITATLARDTAWRNSSGATVNYKAGTTLTLDAKGRVSKSANSVNSGPANVLSGYWTAYIPARQWSHGGYQIIQTGKGLTYVVYSGERHTGRVLSGDMVSYVEANVTGKVSIDGQRIDWSNGTYWKKDLK